MGDRSEPPKKPGNPSAYAPKAKREGADAKRRRAPKKVPDRDTAPEDLHARVTPRKGAELTFRNDPREMIPMALEVGGDEPDGAGDGLPQSFEDEHYIEGFRVPPSLGSALAHHEAGRRWGIRLFAWLVPAASVVAVAAFFVNGAPKTSDGGSADKLGPAASGPPTEAPSQPPPPMPPSPFQEAAPSLAVAPVAAPIKTDPVPASRGPGMPEPRARSTSPLNADTIAALLRRADGLMATGDIAAARLVLREAADAGDARAALALGATYDPVMLRSLGVRGAVDDIAMARMWYDKAKDFGSPDAQQRIERLAAEGR